MLAENMLSMVVARWTDDKSDELVQKSFFRRSIKWFALILFYVSRRDYVVVHVTLFGYFFRKTPRCFRKMASEEAANFDDVDLTRF
jgi:hypothetical protein